MCVAPSVVIFVNQNSKVHLKDWIEYFWILNARMYFPENDVFQVLADYQSDEEPDFTNPSTFRDLSKPMVSNASLTSDLICQMCKHWSYVSFHKSM